MAARRQGGDFNWFTPTPAVWNVFHVKMHASHVDSRSRARGRVMRSLTPFPKTNLSLYSNGGHGQLDQADATLS